MSDQDTPKTADIAPTEPREVGSSDLLALANHWADEARDYRRLSEFARTAGRTSSAALHRGRAEIMEDCARDLHQLISANTGITGAKERSV